MNEHISIRVANLKDADLVADISRQTFHDTFAPQNSIENMEAFMSTRFSRATLMAELTDPQNTFLLAYNGEDVVGYAKLRDGLNPEQLKDAASLEIMRIYSVNSMVGRGIGKILMQHSIDIARQRNKTIVWLGVWELNQRAINFYTKWGFEKFGEHDFLLGNDVQTDWLMKKHL